MPESDLFLELAGLDTEQINHKTANIDLCTTQEILTLINNEDQLVANAVQKEIPNITLAVEKIVECIKSGGRLFYFGAGTSGRLSIVDASECPPTFGTNPELIQGIIAGGREAVFQAQEGAEDLMENGANEVKNRNIQSPDIICGVAASGRTPFVKGALLTAKKRGCPTILITTVRKEQIEKIGVYADINICVHVGPEAITGSTRMKSGTAQKMVLNMLTTATMVRLGKTYGNIMVDLQLTNEKLKERAKRIIMKLTNISYDSAEKYLNLAKGNVKIALVMIKTKLDFAESLELLNKSDGFVRKCIKIND